MTDDHLDRFVLATLEMASEYLHDRRGKFEVRNNDDLLMAYALAKEAHKSLAAFING